MGNSVTKCPGCGKVLNYPPAKEGAVGNCPGCKTKIRLKVPVADRVEPKQVIAEVIEEPEIIEPPRELSVTTQSNVPSIPVPQAHEVAEIIEPTVEETEIARFAEEGQDVAMVARLLERIGEICTSREEPMYMAVQQRPVANIKPDAMVLTNYRAIIFRQKILGRMDFVDVPWLNVHNIHLKENMIGATISVQGMNGHIETIDYLPKAQARKVYRIGQEMEHEMNELRRQREMEEARNAAGNVVVNTAVAPTQTAAASAEDDAMARLQKIKSMLDAGLISQEEFDAKKAQIMDSI